MNREERTFEACRPTPLLESDDRNLRAAWRQLKRDFPIRGSIIGKCPMHMGLRR
jgi:hypothetical protein